MPALVPTEYRAKVIWLGRVVSDDRNALIAEPAPSLDLSFAGLTGSVHSGLTRPSDSRVTAQYPKGTDIRNVRQLALVSVEDLKAIAETMGVASVDPARLGSTVVVEGIPDFSHIPPSARLQAQSGVTLTVDMQNWPCQFPAKSLTVDHGEAAKGFKAAAKGRRGVTAWVEREGTLSLGDVLTLHVPGQRAWQPEG
ncbi:MAG: MOSC domain-containing protein [Pseudomonadota bacterium]